MKTGIFVGTFDPFTIGHDAIVRRALPLFDRLIIGIGINERKQTMLSATERADFIGQLYADDPRVTVATYSELTVDFARRVDADYIVKGIRSVKDFEYEREQADINRMLTGIDTLFFFSEPHLSSISSSVVRELKHFGKEIEAYLPKRKDRDNN